MNWPFLAQYSQLKLVYKERYTICMSEFKIKTNANIRSEIFSNNEKIHMLSEKLVVLKEILEGKQ